MIENVDDRNSIFWNHICGTHMASKLGIKDDSKESLEKYDNFYFDFYPYLLKHVPVENFKNLKVLEVGLGYGSLSQQIAKNCLLYRGLDIASGPVDLVKKRIADIEVDGNALVASIKECPFADNTFDVVVSIGCFHHTGDLQKAISETNRVLKPGGTTYLMVYNKYSYAQILNFPLATIKRYFNEKFYPEVEDKYSTEKERATFDTNRNGKGAPETKFYSSQELKKIMKKAGFIDIRTQPENADDCTILKFIHFDRNYMLAHLAQKFGLDIYFSGVKNSVSNKMQ